MCLHWKRKFKVSIHRHYFNYASLLDHGLGGRIPAFDGKLDLFGLSSLGLGGLGRLAALKKQPEEEKPVDDSPKKDDTQFDDSNVFI